MAWVFLLCFLFVCLFAVFSHPLSGTLAYQYPFVLAFAPGTIEVRTLINGKLVQMLEIPSVAYLTSKKEVYISSSADDRKDSDIYRIAFGE